MKLSFVAIVMMVFVSGCAQQPTQTFAEQESLKVERVTAATQFYEGKTNQEIFYAMEEMFLYLDKKDFTYEKVSSDRVVASHYYFLYGVLSVVDRYLWLDIQTEEQAAGTEVQVIIESQMTGGLQVSPMPTLRYDLRHTGLVPRQNAYSSRPGGIDDYEAFHQMLSCFVYGNGWYDFDQDRKEPGVISLVHMEGLEEDAPEQCLA